MYAGCTSILVKGKKPNNPHFSQTDRLLDGQTDKQIGLLSSFTDNKKVFP